MAGTAGTALAVSGTSSPSSTISGCLTRARTVVDVHAHTTSLRCPKGEAVIQWNATGPQGPAGAKGVTGAAGPQGPSGLKGAYYSVAKYDVGDTNGGAIATVACKNVTDVAISGGVQTLALGTNGLASNVPVSSSFPGRMGWSTNTPIPGRLDGWIVQFGGDSGSTSPGSPAYVDIYALCVPAAEIPVDVTYTESGS
jgi:hypothetical protein